MRIFGRLGDFITRRPWIVVGCWLVIALALPLTVPSLTVMSERNPVAILPADAPSSATAKEISETFREAGSENVLVVLLTNDAGLGPADEKTYATLVENLRRHDLMS